VIRLASGISDNQKAQVIGVNTGFAKCDVFYDCVILTITSSRAESC
jgi:hypothetical protein